MVEVVIRLGLAAVLLLAAGLKLASPRESVAAMAVYGARRASMRRLLWGSAVAVELVLAVGVAAGLDLAASAAAVLMLIFAGLLVAAIAAGRAGKSCACFGPGSTLGWPAVGRNLALAAAFVGLTFIPRGEITTEQWLGLGLVVCLAGLVALTVAVLALAREVGMLRLRLPPGSDSALEVPEEGPPLGQRVAWKDWAENPATGLRLAVFLSEGCHICRELEPRIRAFARNPLLSVELFDEVADSDAWRAFEAPGSPYAVVCDDNGMALAKGTFNTVAQLESVAATAERRRATWREHIPG